MIHAFGYSALLLPLAMFARRRATRGDRGRVYDPFPATQGFIQKDTTSGFLQKNLVSGFLQKGT